MNITENLARATSAAAGEKRRAESLATVLLLLRRARESHSIRDLGYLLANDTSLLVPYRSGLLWLRDEQGGGGRLEAVSNLPVPNRNAALARWISPLFRYLCTHSRNEPAVVDRASLPSELVADWAQYLPAQGLWLPLVLPDGRHLGGLLLAREAPWTGAEQRLLSHWIDGAAMTLDMLRRRGRKKIWGRLVSRRLLFTAGAAAILLGLLFVPVRLNVLAPAEIIPEDPIIVRAPLSGVIDSVEVAPNEMVETGQILVRLDDRELATRLEVARQGFEVVQSELQQASRASVSNQEALLRRAVLRIRVEQHRAEVAYIEEQLSRVILTADRNGVVMFPDRASLRGRPVRLGERIMTLADPSAASLEIWIPPSDSINLADEAEVRLFLNIDPENPLPARLERVAHQATLAEDGNFGYRAEAVFDSHVPVPRIGLRGTAKIYGDSVSLGYYLFRRPLTTLRQAFGT
ncbi:MAG: HlyD family efflux transporter periplasmic adaptor subunit [Desulfatiglandaceae bacterium]